MGGWGITALQKGEKFVTVEGCIGGGDTAGSRAGGRRTRGHCPQGCREKSLVATFSGSPVNTGFCGVCGVNPLPVSPSGSSEKLLAFGEAVWGDEGGQFYFSAVWSWGS